MSGCARIVCSCALALCFWPAAHVNAQLSADTSLASRMRIYEMTRKSPGWALAIEYLITPVGHGYAGDWGRGLWPSLITYGGALMFVEGASPSQRVDDLAAVGFGMFIVGKVWAMVSAVQTAKETNRALRR